MKVLVNSQGKVLTNNGGAAALPDTPEMKLNLAYGLNPPSDTSKIWVKIENEPDAVEIKNQFDGESNYLIDSMTTLRGLSNSAFTVIDNTAWQILGYDDDYRGYQNKNYSYNLITKEKIEHSTSSANGITRYSKAVAINGVGYVIGGYQNTTSTSSQIYKLDPKYGYLSYLRYVGSNSRDYYDSFSVAAVGTKCYIFGGRRDNYSSSYIESSIKCYDTETNTISTLETKLPTVLRSSAASAVGTKCYIFGGRFGNGSSDISDSILCFDSVTKECHILDTKLPQGSDNIGAWTINGKVYLVEFGSDKILCFDPESESIITLDTHLPQTLTSIEGRVSGNEKSMVIDAYNSIYIFTPEIEVPQNQLEIMQGYTNKSVPLIQTPTVKINGTIKRALLGDANNKGQDIEMYVYNETTATWDLLCG